MGQPNEYDLNIVLYNEALMQYSKLVESHPGFLQIQVDMKGFRQDKALMTGTAQAQFEGHPVLELELSETKLSWDFKYCKVFHSSVPFNRDQF